jgi:hypothetical protein
VVKAGTLGLSSAAGGLAAGAFSLWTSARLMALMGDASKHRGATKLGGFFAVGLFLAKVPVLIWLVIVMYRLGHPAPTLFMLAFAMVYCALVGWALTSS